MHHEDDPSAGEGLPDIHGYRLLRMIGHGGMSTVYLARQQGLDRDVALKVMLPEALTDEVSRRRFENEARTIARLEHPHIVSIYEVGRSRSGLPYYSMPYLPRGNLAQRDYSNDHARVHSILDALLSALEYAHARGIVHRDVKSENVLFDDADRPLLADFGIALRRGFGPRVTTAGMAVGSTAYMPPEQARGEQVDGRADLYSMGVVAWEMLTGALPYNAADALSMALQHAQDPIPRLPPELRHWQKFFDKALQKSPAARYQNASEMRQALQALLQKYGTVYRSRGGALPGPASARQPAWTYAGIAVVVLLASGTIGHLLYRNGLSGRSAQPVTTAPASTAARGSPLPSPLGTASSSNGAGPSQQGVLASGASGDPMPRPLAESPASQWLVAAEQQTQDGKLTTPAQGNAYDSILSAHAADPEHDGLVPAVAGLVDRLSVEAERQLRNGNVKEARAYFVRATQLIERTEHPDTATLLHLRDRMDAAIGTLVASAVKTGNRGKAQQAVALAADIPVPQERRADLQRQADAIAESIRVGDADSGESTVISSGWVTRQQYAAFARATGRPASLCRERASPLRVIAPKSWESPGFSQSDGSPVVCVSWNDANAYAQWASRRAGQRYRLPGNSRQAGGGGGGSKSLSQWLQACGESCEERVAVGRSWRGYSGSRPLDPGRGYDDVGFKLVR